MSIKYKVIAVIVTLLLGVSITNSIFNYQKDIDLAQTQLKKISMPLSIDNIYTVIQQKMIEPLIVSSLMANNTFAIDWLLDGEKDISQIQRYLKEVKEKYGMFTTFLVSDRTKNYYHSKGIIDVINKDNSDDDWFYDFKNKKDVYEVNLDYNKHLGNSLVMFINYKLKDYVGDFLAVAGVGIKLFDIEDMLKTFKNKYGYSVYFVDEDGEIMLHTKDLDKRGNISSIDGLREISNDIFDKKITQFEYKSKDTEYLLSVKYIEQLRLYLLVEVDRDEYMSKLDRMLLINLLVSIVVTFLVVFIIVYVINIYQEKLETKAEEDYLTKLPNRRKFSDDFDHLINLIRRGNLKKLTLLILDIDDFKKVNDTYGHLVGDKILVRIAKILKENLRNTDLVARWGGEEFTVLFIDTNKDDAIRLSEKLRVAIKENKEIKNTLDRGLTVSLGLSELTSGDSEDGLITKADNALYEAKNSGKDRLVVV